MKKGEILPTFPFFVHDDLLSDRCFPRAAPEPIVNRQFLFSASLISVRSSTSVGPAGASGAAGFLTLL